jgi:hypothetical protein
MLFFKPFVYMFSAAANIHATRPINQFSPLHLLFMQPLLPQDEGARLFHATSPDLSLPTALSL